MPRERIALIGYGNLGQTIAKHMDDVLDGEIIGALETQQVSNKPPFPIVDTLDELLSLDPNVVVECAAQQALKQYGLMVVKRGIDLVPASVGGLVDDAFRESLILTAKRTGAVVRIPSGAILGVDGLAAAIYSGVDHVLYRGTMIPGNLKNAEKDYSTITERTIIYEGIAREAVQKYPKNANITATLSLAGIGFEKTRVEIILDPEATDNIHEVFVSGDFGQFNVKVVGNIINKNTSPTSKIVAGSLVQAALGSNYTLLK